MAEANVRSSTLDLITKIMDVATRHQEALNAFEEGGGEVSDPYFRDRDAETNREIERFEEALDRAIRDSLAAGDDANP